MKKIALMGLVAVALAVGIYSCSGGGESDAAMNDDGGDGSSGAVDGGGGGGCTPNCMVGMMVSVPSGSFQMGCNTAVDTECLSDENPYHAVNVPAFKIDKYEVTTGEYQACVDSGGCVAADTGTYCNSGVSGRDSHPINCVDWDQAKAYCTWAGKRLPSEAEWEKAARGTDGRKYPWGNDLLDCDHAVHSANGCSNSRTAPVGNKPAGASPYGAEDMAGNVYEWIEDWRHPTYEEAPSDGSAWVTPPGVNRVLRGGSWFNDGSLFLRASYRHYYDPTVRYYLYGIRCALSEP